MPTTPSYKINPATYEDLFHLPDHLIGEIIGGNTKARIEPFASIELDVSRWWLPEEPAQTSST